MEPGGDGEEEEEAYLAMRPHRPWGSRSWKAELPVPPGGKQSRVPFAPPKQTSEGAAAMQETEASRATCCPLRGEEETDTLPSRIAPVSTLTNAPSVVRRRR